MPTPIPSQRFFRPPMVRAIGVLTNFSTDGSCSYKQLLPLVRDLFEDGDPEWPIGKIRPKLYHLKEYHCHIERFDDPGRICGQDHLFVEHGRGLIGLTAKGLEEAKGLEIESRADEVLTEQGKSITDLTPMEVHDLYHRVTAKFEAELYGSRSQNLTTEWLGKRLAAPGGVTQSEIYKAMVATVASKLPVSASTNQVEDHVQECLTRLMYRDSLRERIIEGVEITTSHLASYAFRSACSDIRSMGTNPVCREIYGARTETERRKAKENGTEGRRWGLKDSRVSFQKDEDGVSAVLEIADEAKFDLEDVQAFETFWARMESVLKWRVPGAWPRYAKILKMKVQGGTTKEIAKELGVSDSRTTTMMAVARGIIKEAREAGFFDQCLDVV